MAFTRFKDDPERIEKQLQQQTDQGRWAIDVPGPGNNPPLFLDSHILAQKWGGNLWTNSIDINSSLLGLNKKINRDNVNQYQFKRESMYSVPVNYPTSSDFLTTEQTRAIMPAWTAKDLQQNHSYILFEDPQQNTEMPFSNNSSTRNIEKDNFRRNLNTTCTPHDYQLYTLPVINENKNTKNVKNVKNVKNNKTL
jgi:hypothetical protein